MLTDQNHTILVFLQDRIKKHSNWQVHTRFLFGSGIYYYNRKIVNDPVSGNSYMQVDFNQPLPLPFYFRVDMGCSTAFDMNNNRKLIVTAEVLNMFNQYNYASYDFIQVFKTIPYPIRIPETLSPRLFNIQLEYEL
jgi:hypothetical protein